MRGIRITKDGREICDRTAAGRKVYAERLYIRWELDRGACCLCGLFVMLSDATVEHPNGRGMAGATRDDRLESIRIAHYYGNAAKGSRRYHRYMQLPLEVRIRNCQPFKQWKGRINEQS
jgi:hypothetical protein